MGPRTQVFVLDSTIALILGLVGVICFQGSIDGQFVFDDAEAILNNKDVTQLSTPLFQLLKNDFWGTALTHNSSHKSYRPLTVLSFRFNVWMSGLNPESFHVSNVILHGVASALTYPLFNCLFTKTREWDVKPLLASLLFAVHPIHSEAVAGIVGRADLLCAIFSFISILVYAKATTRTNSSALTYTIVSSIFTGLAMLAKEQGITTFGVCLAYDLIVVNTLRPHDLLLSVFKLSRELKIHKSGIVLFKKANYTCLTKQVHLMLWRHLILISAGCTLMYMRCWVMGFEAPKFQKVDNPASFADSILTRIINYNYVYALNAWIMLCPQWLCFDWSMGCVPLVKLEKIQNNPRILSIIFFWLLFGGLVRSVFSCKHSLAQNVCMALSFIIVPFLPATNIFFRVGFVVAERILYLPSVGFCMLVAIGAEYLHSKTDKKTLVHFAFLVLLVTNVARCYQRSLDWRTERSLFSSGLQVCPSNAKVHYNLAKTSHNSTLAIKHYREAVRLNPDYEQALNNLANVLRDNGDIMESESLLRKAVMIRPDFAAAWMNLGIVLSNLKRFDEALSAYKTALIYRKKYPDCYYNLGNLYLSQQKYTEAFNAWTQATSMKPEHSIAWNNMIVMLDSLGELDKAESLALEALVVLPKDSALHFNLANTLGKKSKYDDAEHHFKIAIELRPQQSLYHTNLGVLYHRWKKYTQAEEQYLIALRINPDLKNVEQNLKNVRKMLLKSNE